MPKRRNKGEKSREELSKMAETLTNVILASILHLIRWDHTKVGRAAPHRAPPRQALARRWHWRHCRSETRATTPPLQYQPMEPSPPRAPKQSLPGPPLPLFGVPYTPRSQVDFGRLVRPPGHIVDLERQERKRQWGGETKDWLGHRHKCGEKRLAC
jgi:hypothetical protein